jgi:hypothetical protein
MGDDSTHPSWTNTFLCFGDGCVIGLSLGCGCGCEVVRRPKTNKTTLTTKQPSRLEQSLQIPLCRFRQDVDSDGCSDLEVPDSHEGLNEDGLGVFEVEVAEKHHADAEVYCSELWQERG